MKTREIINTFKQIATNPRCSGNEGCIRDWLVDFAVKQNWEYETDKAGNILIRVPGTRSSENTIILQAHMDMVYQKDEGFEHDHLKDPIKVLEKDGWLYTDGTTLGADNGLGIAIALEIAKDNSIKRPDLELLFTADEERGLTGANSLKKNVLKGNMLINLDSEDEGIFTIGCAGGMLADISRKYETQKVIDTVLKIEVKGGIGGHSGIDIHKGRANAAKLLARILEPSAQKDDIKLISMNAGTVFNSIPGKGSATIAVKKDHAEKVTRYIKKVWKVVKAEYKNTDPNLKLVISELTSANSNVNSNQTKSEKPKENLNGKDTKSLIDFLVTIPNGVFNMSNDVDDLVETSSNLGVLKLENGKFDARCFLRGSVDSKMDYLNDQMKKITLFWSGKFENSNRHPGWEPNTKSPLLETTKKTYKEILGTEPVVEAVHAGLECGVIGSKYKNLDMISLGPTIIGAHSTSEKAEVESVKKVYQLLSTLLEQI